MIDTGRREYPPQDRAAHGFLGIMTDSEHRALEIHEITFDAGDPHALAAFWAALLEREIRPGDMPQDDSVLVVPAPEVLVLLLF